MIFELLGARLFDELKKVPTLSEVKYFLGQKLERRYESFHI